MDVITFDQKIDIIKQEIVWCESHRDMCQEGKVYEDGFVRGLIHAIYLIQSNDNRFTQWHKLI